MTMATSKTQTALHLADEDLIGTGGMRRCYRHPHVPDRCAKVYRPLAEIPWNDFAKRSRIWMGAHSWTQHMNIAEFQFWETLINNKTYGPTIRKFLPQIDGVAPSNHGLALIEELLLDDDGQPAPNLATSAPAMSESAQNRIKEQLRTLTDCVLENALPIYDWNLTNILIVGPKEAPDIKIADFEGEMANKEFIKISRWSTQARRRKLQRRINRMVENLNRTVESLIL